MQDVQKNNRYQNRESSQSQSQVGRLPKMPNKFIEAFKEVTEKLQVDTLPEGSQRESAKTLCLFVAEVLCLPADATVKIDGNQLPAYAVKNVYSYLRREHLELVLDNFDRAAYKISHKKTYLRTALYNAVLEYDFHYQNEYAADNPHTVHQPFGKADKP